MRLNYMRPGTADGSWRYMIQSMEILQLPLMALEERIEQELAANPVLERKDFRIRSAA